VRPASRSVRPVGQLPTAARRPTSLTPLTDPGTTHRRRPNPQRLGDPAAGMAPLMVRVTWLRVRSLGYARTTDRRSVRRAPSIVPQPDTEHREPVKAPSIMSLAPLASIRFSCPEAATTLLPAPCRGTQPPSRIEVRDRHDGPARASRTASFLRRNRDLHRPAVCRSLTPRSCRDGAVHRAE